MGQTPMNKTSRHSVGGINASASTSVDQSGCIQCAITLHGGCASAYLPYENVMNDCFNLSTYPRQKAS